MHASSPGPVTCLIESKVVVVGEMGCFFMGLGNKVFEVGEDG